MLLLIGVATASTAPRLPGVPPRSFHQLRAAIDDAPQEERTTSQLSDHPSSENTGRIRSSLPFGSSKTVVTKGVTWPVFLASMVATSLASVAITYALPRPGAQLAAILAPAMPLVLVLSRCILLMSIWMQDLRKKVEKFLEKYK